MGRKSKTIKIGKENKKENLHDLRRGKDFLSKLRIAQIINRRLVNLATLKLTPKRQKSHKQKTMATWEKVFATYISVK